MALSAQCPFTVKLHLHCETPTAVFLLLQHARGGLLCDYLTPLKRRQQQRSSVTSKRQCYLHNLRDTKVNKGIINPCHSSNYARDNQKANIILVGSKQEKEGSNGTAYADTERSTIRCQKKEDLKMWQESDSFSLDKKYGENISGSCKKPSTFALLDEYFSSPSQKSIESYVRVWMAEIILALAHLHSNGIICRDLHLRNILISDEGHVLLTHFSVWEDVNEESDLFMLEEEYCAPELFRLEGVTPAADWWSVGALFYEILTGQALRRNHPCGIQSHTEIETASNLSAEASALIRELLVVSPSERLGSGVNGLEDIKSHPFFSSVDWSSLKSNDYQN
ncbi:ribosomal protein S6 kinase delta-1-like [Actinia tenebrosa]|uniref:Ribosomal protein S6 kinase delta-1-like n=1 Tax=Actinia tenebrosa TaxID=6105 RepID=A0A6P8I2M2_ACTTE|nr:ribosomal protein S6 kinase delta-1-like [Actinia tenebrosa]